MQYNTTRCIDENQDNETLKDMTKSGKQRPWREKKIDNVSYADRFCCKVKNIANH
ncbi:replication protein [Staphylococcus hominis]|uniref:replication protein n=1 Tax=Staphylococcus hominis TaxID=1290 RepID=UPI001F56DCCE|nr:replication protein [Staphylococcus hominis]MCI2870292.1 replication protein [Staphylococcus hominis]MDS3894816.1 replication protein [Staphylococcus hominis]